MSQPTTIVRDQRLAAIQKWLQDNGWSPTAPDYDYTPAHRYARDVLGVPRQDRARQYVANAASLLRGEYVNLRAGRKTKNVKISIEEYQQLIDNQKEPQNDNTTNGS